MLSWPIEGPPIFRGYPGGSRWRESDGALRGFLHGLPK